MSSITTRRSAAVGGDGDRKYLRIEFTLIGRRRLHNTEFHVGSAVPMKALNETGIGNPSLPRADADTTHVAVEGLAPTQATDYAPPGLARSNAYRVLSPSIVWIVVAMGCAARVRVYLFNRPVWLDEALLSNEILSRPLLDLLTRQAETQVAPRGYLAITKVTVNAFGGAEMALRLPALLSGLVSLFIAVHVGKRVLNGRVARLVFVSLVAFAPGLIYYSTEAKQYSFDVLATMIVYWLTLRYVQDGKGLGALTLAGATVVWFSHSSVFITAAVGVWLVLRWAKGLESGKVVGIAALWASQILAMRVSTRMSAELAGYVANYWDPYFAPFPPRTFSELRWYADSFVDMLSYSFAGSASGYWHGVPNPVPPTLAVVLAVVVAALVAITSRRRQAIPVVLAATFLLTLCASAMELYPFGVRTALFLVPLILLVVAVVVDTHLALTSGLLRMTAVGLAVLVVTIAIAGSMPEITSPPPRSDILTTIDFIMDNHRAGDWLVVSDQTEPAYEYYRQRDHLILPPLAGTLDRPYSTGPLLNEFAGRTEDRVWLLFSQRVEEVPPLMADLSRDSRLLDWHAAPGSVVLLVDLSQRTDA